LKPIVKDYQAAQKKPIEFNPEDLPKGAGNKGKTLQNYEGMADTAR
jgi:hypothetical protein